MTCIFYISSVLNFGAITNPDSPINFAQPYSFYCRQFYNRQKLNKKLFYTYLNIQPPLASNSAHKIPTDSITVSPLASLGSPTNFPEIVAEGKNYQCYTKLRQPGAFFSLTVWMFALYSRQTLCISSGYHRSFSFRTLSLLYTPPSPSFCFSLSLFRVSETVEGTMVRLYPSRRECIVGRLRWESRRKATSQVGGGKGASDDAGRWDALIIQLELCTFRLNKKKKSDSIPDFEFLKSLCVRIQCLRR